MKKILFAAQVCGLIVTFPICVALEMNHKTGSLPGSNDNPDVIQKVEKTGNWSSNSMAQKGYSLFYIIE